MRDITQPSNAYYCWRQRHNHQEDRTFLILHVKNPTVQLQTGKKLKKVKSKLKKVKDDVADLGEDQNAEIRTLYGVGYFLCRKDSTVKRGAIQKAMLILSYQPYFEMFHLPARATLERYLDDKSSKETHPIIGWDKYQVKKHY